MDEEATTELSVEECWQMLREDAFGRLAFRLLDEVHIVPINYTVERGRLLFSTGEGNKLLSVAMSPEVAFEIDQHDRNKACSVVVRGQARLLGEDEAHLVDELRLESWVGALADNVVEIVPQIVTGRSFTVVHTDTPRVESEQWPMMPDSAARTPASSLARVLAR